MHTFSKVIFTTLVALVLFAAGAGTGYVFRDFILNNQPTPVEIGDFSIYWEAWHHVEEQFYGDLPQSPASTYGAIKGALATLEDPYTLFIEPEPAEREKAQLEGQFGGIGAYVNQDEEGRIVLDPMRGQPAEQAGVQTGDVLIAIDGTPLTPEMTLDQVVDIIRGEVGTGVVLTIEREGADKPLEITVTRAIIETPSAQWRILQETPTIGYIQLTAFTERSSKELGQALDELAAQGAESYILDLRNNGGGLLDSAVNVTSQFLRQGVVLREDRKNLGERVYDVVGGGKALDQPLVVLVNGGTASASEIVAGALQDYERATLVGEKTFGKGSVQLIYELSDDSRLHVTVAKWFTPENKAIDGTGLLPDVEVLYSEEDHASGRDPQLERAIELLQPGE